MSMLTKPAGCDRPVEEISIRRLKQKQAKNVSDTVAVEEPLQLELEYSTQTGSMRKNIAVTMRTPGNDREFAAGFLFTEGIIQYDHISEIRQKENNRVIVVLKENVLPELSGSTRNFYSTSSCGICGKSSIEMIRVTSVFNDMNNVTGIDAGILYQLQDKLKEHQLIFKETGGIHASVLFGLDGELLLLKEDVGRHNALDKLIGNALMHQLLPLNRHVLFLSGRAGFELVQKASMAGIKIIAAAGAPTSLAVELARELNITLIGFLKKDGLNIYSGEHRILL